MSGSKLKYNLQYIEVPLGLKFKTNEIGYTTFYANLGFSFQVNIKATGKDSYKVIENENIKDEIRLLNMGYYFGAGIEYSLGGNTALIAGINWTNGFIDITSGNPGKITLGILQLRAGIIF